MRHISTILFFSLIVLVVPCVLLISSFASYKAKAAGYRKGRVLGDQALAVGLNIPRPIDVGIFSDARLLGKRKIRPRPYSYIEQVVTHALAPEQPKNVQASASETGGYIAVSWSPFDQAPTAVHVYRSNIAGSIGKKIADLSPDARGYVDNDIRTGKFYYYTIQSIGPTELTTSSFQVKSGSITDTFAPNPPTDVNVVPTEKLDGFAISWENPQNEDFAHVTIYRSERKGQIGIPVQGAYLLPKGVELFVDTKVEPTKTYYYTLTAVDENGIESTRTILRASPGNSNPFSPSF